LHIALRRRKSLTPSNPPPPTLLQHHRAIGLNLLTLEVLSTDVETSHGVKITVKGICQVKVKTTALDSNGNIVVDTGNIKLAAQHFLGQPEHETAAALQLTMEGHQRQVLGTLTVEEIYKDREAFASKVMEGVMSDLNGMGYEIVSYTVIDVKDDNGYMDALGATQTAMVKREAAEGVARNEAEQRKKVAEYRAHAEIGESQNQSAASIEVNARRAEAVIAMNDQKQLEADSEKVLEIKRADNMAFVNRQREMATAAGQLEKAKQMQQIMKEQTQQEVEKAIIQLKVTEQQALAAQEEAKGSSLAELVEKRNVAEAIKVEAEAEAYRMTQLAEARAAEIAAIGAAEAASISAKGMAEAAVLKEKNQTYQYMGEAGLASLIVERLPEIAEAIAAPLAKTEKMIFISQDSATGSKVTNDIIKTIATMPDAIEGLTGIDLRSVIANASKGGVKV
jgi:flotillin